MFLHTFLICWHYEKNQPLSWPLPKWSLCSAAGVCSSLSSLDLLSVCFLFAHYYWAFFLIKHLYNKVSILLCWIWAWLLVIEFPNLYWYYYATQLRAAMFWFSVFKISQGSNWTKYNFHSPLLHALILQTTCQIKKGYSKPLCTFVMNIIIWYANAKVFRNNGTTVPLFSNLGKYLL